MTREHLTHAVRFGFDEFEIFFFEFVCDALFSIHTASIRVDIVNVRENVKRILTVNFSSLV